MRILQIFVFMELIVLFLSLCFVHSSSAAQYMVKPGDSLKSISRQFGVSVNEIKEANNLTKTILQANQVLTVPGKNAISSVGASKSKSKPAVYYTVKRGDTLSAIAQKTGVPAKQIMTLNKVHAKSLRIGKKLILVKSTNLSEDKFIDEEDEDSDETANMAKFENQKRYHEELLGKWRNPDERRLFVKVATGFLGAPYRLGGSSLKGIDCSAFVHKIYSIFDIELPRNARAQSQIGVSVDREELVEGDLVFFHTRRSLGHVGIYIGNNKFVHASSTKKTIRIDSMDTPYFQKRFQRAVRIKGLEEDGV
jgi:peptidoglycan endopeptidase LytE